MDSNIFGLDVELLSDELGNLMALVALKLDNLTHVGVGDYGSIASELLAQVLHHLFGVIFFRDSLDGSQRLAAITLLNTNVDSTLLLGELLLVGVLARLLGKGIGRRSFGERVDALFEGVGWDCG